MPGRRDESLLVVEDWLLERSRGCWAVVAVRGPLWIGARTRKREEVVSVYMLMMVDGW